MRKKTVWTSAEVEETLSAIQDRIQLRRVLHFLDQHGADEAMQEAVSNAIQDAENWISPDIEKAYLSGKLGPA